MIVIFLMMSIVHSFYLPSLFRSELDSSAFGSFVKTDPIGINQDFEKIFGDIIIETTNDIEALMDVQDAEPPIELGFQVFDLRIENNLENEMLLLVNKERELRGFKPLVVDDKLRDVARNYGKDMFERGYFGHIDLEGRGPADRMNLGGVLFTASGENLALQPNLSIAHDGLMKSDDHRKNILHFYFHRIGIGVINGGEKGMIFVQNFAD
ncbi:CAP domain-containing protein [Candidatus Parcubacteria bacterium]|nr:CAP domain-containing protein [Candidatus Parcubacteria bacterium]